ncbi:uncharacterized protein RB166_018270 [Leptodactylus fuscus]
MAGPFSEPPFLNFRVSPLGLVPKKEAGKYRLIHHLSFPPGESVNDGIPKEESAVSYVSFDRAVSLVVKAGRGALLAKSDIESAFRLLPVHPNCYHLLGCQFGGFFYYDMCLPMGCSISCRYFEMFSTFLEWVVRQESGASSVIHYLDDFLFVGPAGSPTCQYLLDTFRYFAAYFGVPLARDKTEGPVTSLSFLGIGIDTERMLLHLPQDKLSRLCADVDFCLSSRKVPLSRLQSLLGQLTFACRIFPMGRVFSRRLAMATSGVRLPHHYVRITKVLRDDLKVWKSFLLDYSGLSCFPEGELTNSDLQLFTDASGAVGYGAVFGSHWSFSEWPPVWSSLGLTRNLTLLELFPIVVALELWGPAMANKRILFWCDNESAVSAINSLSSSSLPVLALLRRLVLRCLQYNVVFKARHVPGVDNTIADSRSQLGRFRDLHPEADLEGSPCPPLLWDVVLHP